jgi:hypothetical protein
MISVFEVAWDIVVRKDKGQERKIMATEERTVEKAFVKGLVGGVAIASLCGAALPATLISAGVGAGVLTTVVIADKVYKAVKRKR